MRMLHDIASGMTYIHARGFIHGDLRSSNLFVIEESKKKTSSRVSVYKPGPALGTCVFVSS